MTYVKCPHLGCGFRIGDKTEGPLHHSDDVVVRKLLKHMLTAHTLRDIEELLGRWTVKYLEEELGRELSP